MASLSTKHSEPEAEPVTVHSRERSHYWLMRMCNTCVSFVILLDSSSESMLIKSLVMALVWLFGRQVPLALLPFTVYSVFHVATYTRANLIPTIQPPQQAPAGAASPGGRPATKPNALADTIGRFVKEYYDASMTLVASLEIFLWFRVLFSASILTKGSWILLAIYTVFVRARYSQSTFVQAAVGHGVRRVDALVAGQNTPPAARQAWETLKGYGEKVTDSTDLNRYVGAQGPAAKKAQ